MEENIKIKFERELRRLEQQRKTAKGFYAVFLDETIEELKRILM